jgi:hypothetical protein
VTIGVRALLVIGALFAAGCSQGQAFRVDQRVSIVTPRDRAAVHLPVVVRWRASRVDGRAFGVFVDRAPVRPGKRVVAAATATDAVYVTATHSVTIRQVERPHVRGRERHRATIVLLDPYGRRVGESAWDVVFEVKREPGA